MQEKREKAERRTSVDDSSVVKVRDGADDDLDQLRRVMLVVRPLGTNCAGKRISSLPPDHEVAGKPYSDRIVRLPSRDPSQGTLEGGVESVYVSPCVRWPKTYSCSESCDGEETQS